LNTSVAHIPIHGAWYDCHLYAAHFQTQVQAAQLAVAAANSGAGLASVSMTLPISSISSTTTPTKPQTSDASKGQGQQQGQGVQSQGQASSGGPALVAGKTTMLPQQGGQPLMLGQIGKLQFYVFHILQLAACEMQRRVFICTFLRFVISIHFIFRQNWELLLFPPTETIKK
jgi:hypothetical protein